MFDYEFEFSRSGNMILGHTYDGWGNYNIHHIVAALASMGAHDPLGLELGHEYHNGPVKLWMFEIEGKLFVVDESDIQDMNDHDLCVSLLAYDDEYYFDMLGIAMESAFETVK